MALVTTIHGLMDESLLQRKNIDSQTPDGRSIATEYWLDGELVHRSVHLILNKGADVLGQANSLN